LPFISAILDANVLYPAPIRDLLLNLADVGFYSPKWSDEINDEWVRNLLKNRPDLTEKQLKKTVIAMNNAFEDANIIGYENIIKHLTLPDPGDRHILAAAIKSKSQKIITFNLKHFPASKLNKLSIVAESPDDFISDLIKIDKPRATIALNNQVNKLMNPPKTAKEVLIALEKCGLRKVAALYK
jgi:predicted nucleic acid-binding protein